MRIIIPMAGRGSRLRPHTLTVPKPLLPVAGKPMVQRIVEELAASYNGEVEEIAFVIGDFGTDVEAELRRVAAELGARASIYYQKEPLGTAHAILCARDSMEGPCMVAFADTLFQADFRIHPEDQGVIWVKQVEDPSAFGVVQTNEAGIIQAFIEKSPVFVSDLAIVGIYYFRDGAGLRASLQYLIDRDIRDKGEYQLTSALENMKRAGLPFRAAAIEEWLDCGNKEHLLATNRRMLELKDTQETLVHPEASIERSVIIPPCYIGKGAQVMNSVLGPYVSVGHNSSVEHSVIADTLIQNDSIIRNSILKNSLIGNHVEYTGRADDTSVGDYTKHTT